MNEKFITISKTAKVLNLSYLTVYRKVKSKEIPSIKLTKKILIPVEYFDNLTLKAMSEVKKPSDETLGGNRWM